MDVKKKAVPLGVLLFVSMLTLSVCRISAESTAIVVDPQTSIVNFGDTFGVNIKVNYVVNLHAWQLCLYYISSILKCTNATEGPFLNNSQGTYFSKTITGNYNATHGRLLAYSTILGHTTVNGSGVILKVTFKAVGGGNTALTLADTILGDNEVPSQNIPHVDVSGTVNVIGAPLADIAVTEVIPYKKVVGQGYHSNINVTIENRGGYAETFNITLFASTTSIIAQTITLTSGNSTTLALTWNTSSFSYGNYTMRVVADTVAGETNTTNNSFTDGKIYVGIPGDINGDGIVDVFDAVLLAGAAGSTPSTPSWNPNADINNDSLIDVFDAVILAGHAGEHYP
jgi:hypothetical protein